MTEVIIASYEESVTLTRGIFVGPYCGRGHEESLSTSLQSNDLLSSKGRSSENPTTGFPICLLRDV